MVRIKAALRLLKSLTVVKYFNSKLKKNQYELTIVDDNKIARTTTRQLALNGLELIKILENKRPVSTFTTSKKEYAAAPDAC
ncbi:MAG: hypothetical protein M3139_07260 [Bacteroidota bacterium]|nr:hypothetical protein [Bacteroidota bacterium]